MVAGLSRRARIVRAFSLLGLAGATRPRTLRQEAAAGLLHLPAGAMPQAPQKNAASFAMLVVHASWHRSM